MKKVKKMVDVYFEKCKICDAVIQDFSEDKASYNFKQHMDKHEREKDK